MSEESLFEIDCQRCQGPLEGDPERGETILGEAVYCPGCRWVGHARFKPEVERQIENQMEKGTKRKSPPSKEDWRVR